MFTAAGWRGEIKKKAGCRIGKVCFGPSVLKLVLFLKDKRFHNIRSFQLLCIEPLMSVRLPPSPSELELQNSRKQVIVTIAPRQTRTSCSELLQVPLIMMWSSWWLFLLSWNAISACGYPCPGKVRVDLMVDGGNPFLLMVNILWPLKVCN